MLKTVTLKALTPWPQFNEYEGEVVVEVDGRELTCHVVLSSADEWKQHKAGERLPAELWLERDRTWEKVQPDAPPLFRQIGGVHYEVVGLVREIGPEMLVVDAGFPLSVHLVTRGTPQGLAVGDKIHVDGSMTIELEPEPDDAGGGS
jgi:hypothetical protein